MQRTTNNDLDDQLFISLAEVVCAEENYQAEMEHVNSYQTKMSVANTQLENGMTLQNKEDAAKEIKQAIQKYFDLLEMDLLEKYNYVIVYSQRGKAYLWLNELDLALQDFEDALEIAPNDCRIISQIGLVYLKLANKHKEKDSEKFNFYSKKADHYLKLSLELRKSDHTSEKLKYVNEYCEDYERKRQILAKKTQKKFEYDELSNLSEIKDATAMTRIISKLKDAAQVYDKANPVNLNAAAVLAFEAKKDIDNHEYKNGIEKYLESHRLIPNELVLTNIGCAYLRLKDGENAIKYFTQAIQLRPMASAYFLRAKEYCIKKKYDLMFEDLFKFFACDLQTNGVEIDANIKAHQLNLRDQVIKMLQSQASAEGNVQKKFLALYGQTLTQFDAKHYEKAASLLTAILKMMPDYDFIYMKRGIAYLHANKCQLALCDLNTAIWLKTHAAYKSKLVESIDVYYVHRRDVYLHLGMLDEAIQDHDAVLKNLDAQYHEIANIAFAHALLEKAKNWISEQKFEQAIDFLNQAIKILSTDTQFQFACFLELSVAFRQIGNITKVNEYFEKAKKINPDHPRIKRTLFVSRSVNQVSEKKESKSQQTHVSNNFPNNAKARRKLEPRTSISVVETDTHKGSGAIILQELAKQKLLQKDLARQEKNKKQSKKRKAKKIRVIQAVVESKHEEAEKLREKQESLAMTAEDTWLAVANIPMQQIEKDIILHLKSMGAKAALGGSSVRHRIQTKVIDVSKDIDIVTDASEADILASFVGCNIYKVDAKPGLFKIFTPDGLNIDIFSSEKLKNGYEAYAETLDFTVNALFADETGAVTDPLNRGLFSLKTGELATIADAKVSFSEDPIRMLRAMNALNTSKLKMSKETFAVLESNFPLLTELTSVNPGHVNAYLRKMFSKGNAVKTFESFLQNNLFALLFPKASDGIIKAKAWILTQLRETDKRSHVSLNYIYMCFVVSATQSNSATEEMLQQIIIENPLFKKNFESGYGVAYLAQIITSKWRASFSALGPDGFFQPGAPNAEPKPSNQHATQLVI